VEVTTQILDQPIFDMLFNECDQTVVVFHGTLEIGSHILRNLDTGFYQVEMISRMRDFTGLGFPSGDYIISGVTHETGVTRGAPADGEVFSFESRFRLVNTDTHSTAMMHVLFHFVFGSDGTFKVYLDKTWLDCHG
jgi:hypothetical protein